MGRLAHPQHGYAEAIHDGAKSFVGDAVGVPVRQHDHSTVAFRWFPAEGNRAVIVLPHWNANGIAYKALGPIMNRFGISMLRMSKPSHDIRRPQEIARSDYAVSPNI